MIAELLTKSTSFGCVGTKDDLDEQRIKLVTLIGLYLGLSDKRVNSGNAVGCDQLYANGANSVKPGNVWLYLVNKQHNPDAIVAGNHLEYESDHPEWAAIAKEYHGAYDKMSPYVQKLFNRNAGIVTNSNVLIAMTHRGKKWGGGTGHDIRIARGLGIPVIDLNNEEVSREVIATILASGFLQ